MLAPGLLLASTGHGDLTETVHVTVGLLSVAVIIGVLTRFVRVPYTVALVLAGLAITVSGAAPAGVYITQELVLLLFLPPLLFQAGLHLDLEHLRRAWRPVFILAFPGVIATSFGVALAIGSFLPDGTGGFAAALLMGVVMAPTDPISVVATFRTAGVPQLLKDVVEGESLFNDGTAVALFSVLKSVVFAAGTGAAVAAVDAVPLTVGSVGIRFIYISGIGMVLGLGLGLIAFWLLRQLEDPTLETMITVALAWGSFVMAESLGASGVIAVVVSALIIGNYGTVLSMSDRTRTTLLAFWASVDFLANSLLFLLVGFELSDPGVVGAAGAGGWRLLLEPTVLSAAGAVLLALLLCRAAVVFPTVWLLKREWPRGWKWVIWWAGLRGSLSLALILGLPAGPLRAFLAPVAFLVVLASLLGQALSMPTLVRRTGSDEAWPVGS
jgi:CPA1 family monovalent cation:H+ antiporter